MHWIDIALLVLLGISALTGLKSGLVAQAWSLVVLIAAFLFSGYLTPYIYEWLAPHVGANHLVWLPWLVAFCAILVVGHLLKTPITSLLSVPLGFVDNLLGAVLSVAITALVLGLLGQVYLQVLVPLGLPPLSPDLQVLPRLMQFTETLLPNYLLFKGGEGVALRLQ